MVSENLLSLLPDDYRDNIVIPEIKEGLHYDETTGFIKFTVSGDVSHFSRMDNPIIELFRAVEQDCRDENNDISITVGCPRYDSATQTTSCNFLPNNVNSLKGDKFVKEVKKILGKVKGPFEEALTKYFQKENNGFADWQIYHSILDTIVDNKDSIDRIIDLANKSLKTFIKSEGYHLPKRRARQNTQDVAIPMAPWMGLKSAR